MGEDLIDEALHADNDEVRLAIAAFVVVGAIALWLADRLGSRRREIDGLSVPGAVTIGLSQALALLPGISRSGATISTGLALGLTPRVRGALQLPAGDADHPGRRPVRLAASCST